MKKTPLLLTSFLILVASASSAAMVTGSLVGDVRWTREAGPYQVQGPVIVASDSTLTLEPGTRVVMGPGSGLEIRGVFKSMGTAANPVIIQMSLGTFDSYLLLANARAEIVNTKLQGGAFVVRDSELRLEGCEVAKGSGVVLQGATAAEIRNNKIYGNATGLTLDGTVELEARFNTIVRNTYGLFVKDFNHVVFANNSTHGNQQFEVVNRSPKAAPLGGNYWGVDDWASLKPRVQGDSDFDPLRSLKDVLRAYVKTMLPPLPPGKAAELRKAELKRQADERRNVLAVKKRRAELARKEKMAALAAAKALTPVPTPVEETEAPAAPVEVAAPAPVPKAEPAPAAKIETVTMPTAPSGKSSVVALPQAVRTLKPHTNLPPAQALPGDIPATSGKSPMSGIAAPAPEPEPVAPAPAAAPAVVIPTGPAIQAPSPDVSPAQEVPPVPDASAAPALGDASAPPPLPDFDMAPPPDMGGFDIPFPEGEESPVPAAPEPAAPTAAPAVVQPTPVPTEASSTPPSAPAAPMPAEAEPPALGDLELPPMGDIDVPPPADLELPKDIDLGDFSFD